jgi:hypothetical protein
LRDYCLLCSLNFELYFFFSGGVTSLVFIFFFFKFKKIFLSGLSRRRFGDYCLVCSFNFELYFFFSRGVTSLVYIYIFFFSNSKKKFCLGLAAEGLVIIVCFVP